MSATPTRGPAAGTTVGAGEAEGPAQVTGYREEALAEPGRRAEPLAGAPVNAGRRGPSRTGDGFPLVADGT